MAKTETAGALRARSPRTLILPRGTAPEDLVGESLRQAVDALERLWRYGHLCTEDDTCEPGCPHDDAKAILVAAGRVK